LGTIVVAVENSRFQRKNGCLDDTHFFAEDKKSTSHLPAEQDLTKIA